MTLGPLLTILSIRAALLLYVSVLAGALFFGSPQRLSANRWWPRAARVLWTLACASFWVHMLSAFHFYHDWSHAAAVAATAEETRSLLGVSVGAGVYFNYLFAGVWLADVAGWWLAPEARAARSQWIGALVHGYLFFIAFSGAVVFEMGPVRWAGIAACILLLVLGIRRLCISE